MELKKLSRQTAPYKERPVRVLQFGEGNFLRAFVDWQIDIANEKGVLDTNVAIISPRLTPIPPSSGSRPRTDSITSFSKA